jgi:hypothetical protein
MSLDYYNNRSNYQTNQVVENKTQYNNGEVGISLTHMGNLLAQLINEEVGIYMVNILAL